MKAPLQREGAQLPCPKCGTLLTVPASETSDPPKDDAAQFASLVSSLDSNAATPSDAAPPPMAARPAEAEAKPRPQPVAAPSVAYETVNKGQVRIVDIKLPFASVFRLALQFWAVGFLVALVVWLVVAIVAIVLSAIGIGLSTF